MSQAAQLPTKVVLILDDSGSMYSTSFSHVFVGEIRKRFDDMANRIEANAALRTSVDAVVFSCEAQSGKRLMRLPKLSQSTNISSGFRAMHELVGRSKCGHCIVVFISDGVDDRGNEAKIAALAPLPCKATLITVAVGEGFPTSLVVDKLRPTYHTYGGDAVPLVIELPSDRSSVNDMVSDVDWVVSQVQAIIEAGGTQREYTLGELASLNDVQLISLQCKLWYNACTIRCMAKGTPHEEKVACIKEAKGNFDAAEQLMKGLVLTLSKPLPSNLRARRPLFLLASMREKLNQLLARLATGARLDAMSDRDRAKYLSYANSGGRFLHKTLEYHSVDFPTSLASLMRFLTQYEGTPKDEKLMDNINLCSWRDYCEDAALNLDAFRGATSLAGVLDTLPFVGRGVELHAPIPDCAQINPWLMVFMVKDLPATLKGVSTYDLHTLCGGEIKLSGGGRINAIVIGGGSPSCPGIFCHVQTYCLIRNWMAYFNDIRLIGAGMLAMHVLCNYPKQEEWHLEELARARDICALHTPANSRWWIEYLEVAGTAQFRRCLVTESKELPRCMMCPDLSKFMLATWWLADQGRAFSREELVDRCQATVAEFLGRSKMDHALFLSFFDISREGGALDLDAAALVRKALPAPEHRTPRRVAGLLRAAFEAEVRQAGRDASKRVQVALNVERLMAHRSGYLSIGKIQCFFARMLGGDEGIEHWEGLSSERLLRALSTSCLSSSYDRSRYTAFLDQPERKMLDDMAVKLAGSGSGAMRQTLLAEGMALVRSGLHAQHDGLPRVIPSEHWLRYQTETGRDISETWRLDEAGLSTVACCFPECDLYLTIPPGSPKQQRAIIQDHLRTCCRFSIPGLHRCVSAHSLLPAEEIAELVRTGAELREPFLPRDVTRRLAKGAGVYDGVPRGFASAESFRSFALVEAARGLPDKIQAAIDGFTGGDDAQFLELIERLRASLRTNAAWNYAEFKATFDAKYAAMGL